MRLFLALLFILLLTGLVLVFSFGVSPGRIELAVEGAVGLLFSLACPLFFVIMLLAPGLGYRLSENIQEAWERLKGRRAEIEDLTARINHLGKPHHMAQLAGIYLRQGRYKVAADWFAHAIEKDPDLLDARYQLAVCRLREKRYQEAVDLLEHVHAKKPDHDYGGAYLRLAQACEKAGKDERARQVYPILLRFYPGHPEGCYGYGLLLDRCGRLAEARKQMEQVVFSVRNSPRFQRRRNRHLMWKARRWLWTRGRKMEAAGPSMAAK